MHDADGPASDEPRTSEGGAVAAGAWKRPRGSGRADGADQNFSTQGRRSSSCVQALRGWPTRCR